jgi:hypothetical protein
MKENAELAISCRKLYSVKHRRKYEGNANENTPNEESNVTYLFHAGRKVCRFFALSFD